MKFKHTYSPLFLAFFLIWTACSKTGGPDEQNDNSNKDFTIAVLNEGNYTWSNASLTMIHEDSGIVRQNYFESVNNAPLGDVAQSFTRCNESIFIVVNNSGKIEEVDAKTWERKRTLGGLTSPRYILPINDQKAYVSDLYANAIHIVDLQTFEKTGEIPMNGWTEQMVLYRQLVWVVEVENKTVKAINTLTDQVVETLFLDATPRSMSMSSNYFEVLASNEGESLTYFYSFDGEGKNIDLKPALLDGNCSMLRYGYGCIEASQHYYICDNSKVYRSRTFNAGSQELILDLSGRNIYGFEIIDDYLYFCDAKDYARNGVLLKYTLSDNPVFVDSFTTGRIPQAILGL
ncbi:MAG: DUF5074 domain-containing protein [Chitinophagales bacterium]